MNQVALWKNVHLNDWIVELAIIPSNGLCNERIESSNPRNCSSVAIILVFFRFESLSRICQISQFLKIPVVPNEATCSVCMTTQEI